MAVVLKEFGVQEDARELSRSHLSAGRAGQDQLPWHPAVGLCLWGRSVKEESDTGKVLVVRGGKSKMCGHDAVRGWEALAEVEFWWSKD